MIQASVATKYIADELEKLIQSNQIKGKLNRSKSSISIYLRTKDADNPPPKYFRGSNHHPTHASLLGNKWKPWISSNLSIEFTETRYNNVGKKLDNDWNDVVRQNEQGSIQPFSIDVYEYKAASLDESDIPMIFDAICEFTFTGSYSDPLMNTSKAARYIPRQAKIKPYKPKPMLDTNITVDKQGNYIASTQKGHGADYVSEAKDIFNKRNYTNNTMKTNKKVIRLSESDLHRIIESVVKNVLNEHSYQSDELPSYDEGQKKREINQSWREYSNIYRTPRDDEFNPRYRFASNQKNPTFDSAENGVTGKEDSFDDGFPYDFNYNVYDDGRAGGNGTTSLAAQGQYDYADKNLSLIAKSMRSTPRQSYMAGLKNRKFNK